MWPCMWAMECLSVVFWRKFPDSKVHGAHLGPTGPRWAPCWCHELCYLGGFCYNGITLNWYFEMIYWAPSQYKDSLFRYGNFCCKDKTSWDSLIFIMGILISVNGFLILRQSPGCLLLVAINYISKILLRVVYIVLCYGNTQQYFDIGSLHVST